MSFDTSLAPEKARFTIKIRMRGMERSIYNHDGATEVEEKAIAAFGNECCYRKHYVADGLPHEYAIALDMQGSVDGSKDKEETNDAINDFRKEILEWMKGTDYSFAFFITVEWK